VERVVRLMKDLVWTTAACHTIGVGTTRGVQAAMERALSTTRWPM